MRFHIIIANTISKSSEMSPSIRNADTEYKAFLYFMDSFNTSDNVFSSYKNMLE